MKKSVPPQTQALKAALRLLRFRPRSVRELSTRLRKRFDEATCRHVIQELEEKKLLDDYAFSQFWIENRVQFRPRGKTLLVRELRQKGVDNAIIQEALKGDAADDKRMAERLLLDRMKRMDPRDPKRGARLYRFLRSRGFTHEVVSGLLGEEGAFALSEDAKDDDG